MFGDVVPFVLLCGPMCFVVWSHVFGGVVPFVLLCGPMCFVVWSHVFCCVVPCVSTVVCSDFFWVHRVGVLWGRVTYVVCCGAVSHMLCPCCTNSLCEGMYVCVCVSW